jgi:hypothetical protein
MHHKHTKLPAARQSWAGFRFGSLLRIFQFGTVLYCRRSTKSSKNVAKWLETYRNRIILCAVAAAGLHFLLIPLLSSLKEGEDDTYVFSPWGVDTSLAPLPSVVEESPLLGGAPEHALPGRRPVGLSSSLVPVPPAEADLISPADTNYQHSPINNSSVGANTSQFTPQQDSAYYHAKGLHITSRIRFRGDVARTDSAWKAEKQRRDNTPEALMQQNLAVTPEQLQPTARDQINHAQQYTPGAPQNISPNIPRMGVTIPFSMGGLLGYEEDVSATVEYKVPMRTYVRITVYSVQGDTISHPFAGEQSEGKHSFTWDATNDEGRRVPPGDYVAEIVIGNSARILKHIVVS